MYKKIKTIIATQFNIDEDEITKDTSFKDTLNADSLDLVELIMALEDEFGLEMEDEDMDSIKTVGDAVEYITNALEE
ncbi:acyl carrier protein [Tissierella praeacuta]|uniref:acyl carrier protein n=1 Tax=Tissierella praeacuta TaxID=43131 RepID=UPI0033659519